MTESDKEELLTFSREIGAMVGRFIDVLITRGVMSDFDKEYIAHKITADEWGAKYLAETSPTNLGNLFESLFKEGEKNEEDTDTI